MKAEELEELHWRHLTRQEWFNCNIRLNPSVKVVFEEDIDNFVENLVQDICKKANMPYYEVERVFVDKNSVFYALKNNLFTVNMGSCQVWDTLIMNVLRQLLEVPDFSEVDKRKKRRISRRKSRRKSRRNK